MFSKIIPKFIAKILVLLGGQIRIESLSENQTMRISVPPCTPPNELLRLRKEFGFFETLCIIFNSGAIWPTIRN